MPTIKQTPKCENCKSKNTRHRRTRNGREQFVCKDCWALFTPKNQNKKEEKNNPIDIDMSTVDWYMTYVVLRWMYTEKSELLKKYIQETQRLLDLKQKQEDIAHSRSVECNKLYNRIARRNVAICLLVAWLAIVSGMLFY